MARPPRGEVSWRILRRGFFAGGILDKLGRTIRSPLPDAVEHRLDSTGKHQGNQSSHTCLFVRFQGKGTQTIYNNASAFCRSGTGFRDLSGGVVMFRASSPSQTSRNGGNADDLPRRRPQQPGEYLLYGSNCSGADPA